MADSLSPTQAQALFDILTHHETYREIQAFEYPDAISTYGPPFQTDDATVSTSPLLQGLLSRFVLTLPGLKNVSSGFWDYRCLELLKEFAVVELSQSYDRGILSLRKTLATACSAIIEFLGRGVFGGLSKQEEKQKRDRYDASNPEDSIDAWNDFLQRIVYDDMIDELFDKAKETDKLEDHSLLVQAAHEYLVVSLASFAHYILVLNPEGQSLLTVVENIHKLVPYTIMRSTLRVGNVATMISGMMKLLLAKMSVGSLTNWIGWSAGADEGMNLLQTIISQVISWDVKALKARATKLERSKDAPSKEQFDALKEYLSRSREEREQSREQSRQQPLPLVSLILATSTASVELSEEQEKIALEYVNIQFAIHDREAIANVLCHHQPDHLTQAIRDCVSAYEPVIRHIHNAADLSGTLSDFEAFLTDLIKLTKGNSNSDASKQDAESLSPSVEDYTNLIKKHIKSTHKFLHQVAKNGPEITKWYHDYVRTAASQFHISGPAPTHNTHPAAGTMTPVLQSLISSLSDADRAAVLPELDAHATYLAALASSSNSRFSAVVANDSATSFGPGTYLARWQALLDATPITPVTNNGKVRYGRDLEVKEASKVYEAMKASGQGKVGNEEKERRMVQRTDGAVRRGQPEMPGVGRTVELLGAKFRDVLAGMGEREEDVD
ncbi:hypothetical protein EV356DRAFT_466999 [Viridothelium virens]|uniref:Uncharacterized protein n=1 Tax=Viridothelium virens TaxID=1048519 RepID=A0A6A6HA86_VIRVR|nr:hypothetical protein EV356DRAFT_466999 [Viridothelium virens]